MLNFYQFRFTLSFITLYFLSAYLVLQNLSSNSSQNVISHFGNRTLLVVAHPDDETMFFGPTILSLMKNNKSLTILCLSNGNANQDGERREKELASVVGAFGSKVSLIKSSKLQDGMTIDWNDHEITAKIQEGILRAKDPIRTILTFDFHGVSGHINHKSINRAVLKMGRNLKDLNINVITLNSVSILRKYIFFLDSLFTVALNQSPDFTIALSLPEHSLLKEILKLHQSQMVWFRKLYMNFSRYMFLNDLKPIFQ